MIPTFSVLALMLLAGAIAAAGHSSDSISQVWSWLNAANTAAKTGTAASTPIATQQLTIALPMILSILLGVIAVGLSGANWQSIPPPSRTKAREWPGPRAIAVWLVRASWVAAKSVAEWIPRSASTACLPRSGTGRGSRNWRSSVIRRRVKEQQQSCFKSKFRNTLLE